MSEQVVADPLEFARGWKNLHGDIAIAHLGRAREYLASTVGEVHFQLAGYLNENGEPGLHCQVQGTLKLVCQRCLEAMDYALEIDVSLLLASGDLHALAEDDPEAPDRIPMQCDMPVAELVEEEILLTLPMAPHHPEGACKSQEQGEIGKLHPFAALARLKIDKAG